MRKPEKIFYFASTHWDREWYKTVDEFRYRLVPVMEHILETLEKDENFTLFTLDGQTRILDDYLTVGEHNRERLTKLIQSNRLRIGPWYTMPDEFLLSHESIVRNLQKGYAIAEKYGVPPLKNGYVCDTFGHIAALPQILNGFGITSALISRGTNDCETPCFFRWRSPDGDEVFTFKAPETCGYGSFYYEVLSDFAPDYKAHEEEIFQRAVAYVNRELTRTDLPYVILMDGMDHETIHEIMPAVLKRLQEFFGCPVLQMPLDEVFNQIRNTSSAVPVLHGEIARLCKDNVMHNKLIPHTLSSRYDLKRANDDCQTLLEKCAMPICAARRAQDERTYREFLDYAWDVLLLNHAHDSICGCSIDAVHREMLTRFEKVGFTAKGYINEFLAAEYRRDVTTNGKTVVKVYNPLPWEYEGTITFDIDFTDEFPVQELPNIKYEQRNAFRIYDADGNELKYNIERAARRKKNRDAVGDTHTYFDTHTVTLRAKLQPSSFTAFEIRPADRPYRVSERFSTSPTSCDNGLIAFHINKDGTVCIHDKETGRVYDGLHSFTDCGEVGDGWFHIRPIADQTVSSLGAPVTVKKTFDGYAACKFLIVYEMKVPARAEKSFGFFERTGETLLKIESEFTVERASKLISVHTTVHNAAYDHKLCLRLPVANAERYFVNQCNLILERAAGIDPDTFDWKETDIAERQFENMVFTREDDGGLLFLSKGGLHEVAHLGANDCALSVTLLRAFRTTVGTNGEKDGELHGELSYDYALMPIHHETDCALVQRKDSWLCPRPCFTVTTSEAKNTPVQWQYQSEECAYVTCMQEGDGIVVRAANYVSRQSNGTLTFARPPREAYLCDYLGNRTAEVTIKNNAVHFVAGAYKTVNVKVIF